MFAISKLNLGVPLSSGVHLMLQRGRTKLPEDFVRRWRREASFGRLRFPPSEERQRSTCALPRVRDTRRERDSDPALSKSFKKRRRDSPPCRFVGVYRFETVEFQPSILLPIQVRRALNFGVLIDTNTTNHFFPITSSATLLPLWARPSRRPVRRSKTPIPWNTVETLPFRPSFRFSLHRQPSLSFSLRNWQTRTSPRCWPGATDPLIDRALCVRLVLSTPRFFARQERLERERGR